MGHCPSRPPGPESELANDRSALGCAPVEAPTLGRWGSDSVLLPRPALIASRLLSFLAEPYLEASAGQQVGIVL